MITKTILTKQIRFVEHYYSIYPQKKSISTIYRRATKSIFKSKKERNGFCERALIHLYWFYILKFNNRQINHNGISGQMDLKTLIMLINSKM